MPPRKAPAQTEDRRRQILAAARELMVRRPAQDIVLEDVAKAADVAKGTLYLYFRNKEELFAAAYEDLATALGSELEAVLGSGLEGRPLLDETLRRVLGHLDLNRDFISQLLSGGLQGGSAKLQGRCLERIAENVSRVERILERCAAAGLLKLEEPRWAALALFSLCRGALLQKLLGGGRGPLAKEGPKVAAFFLKGLGA